MGTGSATANDHVLLREAAELLSDGLLTESNFPQTPLQLSLQINIETKPIAFTVVGSMASLRPIFCCLPYILKTVTHAVRWQRGPPVTAVKQTL